MGLVLPSIIDLALPITSKLQVTYSTYSSIGLLVPVHRHLGGIEAVYVRIVCEICVELFGVDEMGLRQSCGSVLVKSWQRCGRDPEEVRETCGRHAIGR